MVLRLLARGAGLMALLRHDSRGRPGGGAQTRAWAGGPNPGILARDGALHPGAIWMVLLHLAEIAVWAVFYAWRDAMPDLTSAAYFSAVTYTTTGYGDLMLPEDWRLVGGIEALTGILMCGWSTAFFFALVSRLYEPRQRHTPDQ